MSGPELDEWQLVPKEPTQEMLDACGPKPPRWDATDTSRRLREACDKSRAEDYRTMLSAAPQPAPAVGEQMREAAFRLCARAKLADVQGNGALNYIVAPYLMDDLRVALSTEGS